METFDKTATEKEFFSPQPPRFLDEKQRDFCLWHRRIVDCSVVSDSCGATCLLQRLAEEGKDFRDPKQVEFVEGVTVHDLIKEAGGWIRWRRICDIPSTVSSLLKKLVNRQQWPDPFDDIEI